ncbi:ABC transporter [Elizabethkingia anophelis]|nr:ABC transporter [Elizabethkingia anophelis]
MKLLRLKIENKEGFRSLQQGFEINFHSLLDTEAMEKFRPFCFAGLNGSGKSNVLEALANIFYHLEICVARYLPDSIQNFQRTECTPDAFILEYLIGQHNRKQYTLNYFDKVTIVKKEGKEPQMFIQPYPFDETVEEREVSLVPSRNKESAAEGKTYLPAHIIGYSSGENEILSLPFIKSRLIHLDEYLQAVRDNYNEYLEAENSLIYVDNNMSQAVLLVCLLFEDDDTLAPLRNIDNTGILGLRSFRMNINLQKFEFKDAKGKLQTLSLIDFLEHRGLDNLKKCATSLFLDYKTDTLWLDFYVNDVTINAFRNHFSNALECFHLFRLLYELNNYFIDEITKADVYRSKGIYTDGKLPTPSPSQDVFHFLDFYITKELKRTGEKKDLLLRSFSDGEHQFIHTMGICLLLKDRRTLLLLDEPETHFNPSWRAKFVKILNDSIEAGNKECDFNVHLLKDVLLTSHSPFIISDCLPDNVILFEKEKNDKTTAKKVSELENAFNTYGTSVELILDKLFDYNQSIGDLSFSEIDKIDINEINTSEEIAKAKATLRNFGESIEKDMVLSQLNRKLKDNQNAKNL